MSDQLLVARPSDTVLVRLLTNHPNVIVSDSEPTGRLQFIKEGRERQVLVGDTQTETRGLVELMDNNPMVCADIVSIPSPMATLALIALGPIFRAGLVVEDPVIHTNATGQGDGFWAGVGWMGEIVVEHEEQESGGVLLLTAMAVITTPQDWSEIDSLYDEAYGRSFYVRPSVSDWNVSAVANRPWAIYRLRMTPDEPNSLLTIQVMADANGKCGAAQMIHAMNVMAGFEECLGIPESLPV